MKHVYKAEQTEFLQFCDSVYHKKIDYCMVIEDKISEFVTYHAHRGRISSKKINLLVMNQFRDSKEHIMIK